MKPVTTMNNLIVLEHIEKSFDEQQVLSDFSYTFKDKGSYLIYGPSGCGKTTLINIIAGIETIDHGRYTINGDTITNATRRNSLFLSMSYITQDSYFIDYLTVQENLELSCDKSDARNAKWWRKTKSRYY